MSASLIDRFSVLSALAIDVKASIGKFFLFNNKKRQNAIVIRRDDNVFGVGANNNGCLGTGKKGKCNKARKITPLCKKEIRNISVGHGYVFGESIHVLALSADGSVYSWGCNDDGQLGNGTTNRGPSPALVNNIQHKKIVQVACGGLHSLALSDDGEIYAWGCNSGGQIGSDTGRDQLVPLKVTSQIGTRRAISIACGGLHSVALLDNGEVYTWGCNREGQLGLGSDASQSTPCKVEDLSGVVITQIVCGWDYTLVLTQEGSIYSWGENDYGQLGTGDKTKYYHPKQIRIGERFTKIAADQYGGPLCISAGLTDTGRVYMWGGDEPTSPYLTEYTIIDEVFANIPDKPFTWRLCSAVADLGEGSGGARSTYLPAKKGRKRKREEEKGDDLTPNLPGTVSSCGTQTDIDTRSCKEFEKLRVQLHEIKTESENLRKENDTLSRKHGTLLLQIESIRTTISPGYMNLIRQEAVKKCWFQLLKDIGNPADICDVLISKEIFAHDTLEKIMANRTNQAKCRHLLNVVRVGGQSAFDAFLTALRICHRTHLADQLDNTVSEASGGNR